MLLRLPRCLRVYGHHDNRVNALASSEIACRTLPTAIWALLIR
jgi:hypothetical protein